MRILIVDDNVDSADSLAMLLRLMGHDVHTAYDGQSALDAVPDYHPTLMLLDIGLPRVDGYEVARRLRLDAANQDLFLIAMTGYGLDEDRRRSSEAGFNAHLVKPVDLDVLATMVAKLREKATR